MKIYDKGGKSLTWQVYNGDLLPYPLAPGDLREQMQAVRNMPSRPDDVLIAAFPKSGMHWVMEAVHMLLNNTTEYLAKDLPSSTGDIDGMLVIEFLTVKKLESIKSPRLMVTHLRPKYIPKDFKGKIIHMTRNPKDVAVSLYMYLRHLSRVEYEGEWEDFIPLYTEGTIVYGPPFVHLREWRDIHADHPELHILNITYENLHQDFLCVLKRISSFLNVKTDGSFLERIKEKCIISKLRKSRDSKPDAQKVLLVKDENEKSGADYLFRKGVIGDWKNWFTVAQSENFDAAYVKEMNS